MAEAMSIAKGHENVVLLNSKHEFGANLVSELVVMKWGLILGQRNEKRRRGGGGGAAGGEGGGGIILEEEDREEVAQQQATKRRRSDWDPPEGPSELNQITSPSEHGKYAHWTKEELEEETRKRRLKQWGGKEEMIKRLLKEDKSQPKLCFIARGTKGIQAK